MEVVCIFSVLIPFSYCSFSLAMAQNTVSASLLSLFCSSLVFYPSSLVAVVLLSKIVDDSLITVWMMMYSCLFCLCSYFSLVVLR